MKELEEVVIIDDFVTAEELLAAESLEEKSMWTKSISSFAAAHGNQGQRATPLEMGRSSDVR